MKIAEFDQAGLYRFFSLDNYLTIYGHFIVLVTLSVENSGRGINRGWADRSVSRSWERLKQFYCNFVHMRENVTVYVFCWGGDRGEGRVDE